MDASAPGLDPRSRRHVDDLVDLARGVLGDSVIGLWLHGSAVHGGLRPGSDLDLLGVIDRPTTEAERAALIRGLLARSGRRAVGGPARSVELTLVVASDVRPWRYPPRLELQYGDWWRAELERGDTQPWSSPNPDLAIVLAAARQHSRPLLGPPLDTVLEPVPRADLVRAMRDALPSLLDDLEGDTANVVLTLARILVTLATGEIRPKDAAADWLRPRLATDQRAVLDRARAAYLGGADEHWEGLAPAARSHAAHVVAAIRRAMTEPAVVIERVRPDTPDARSLILELEDHLASRYPAASRHGFSVDRLLADGVDFFVLRAGGLAAGCGGILSVDGEYAELKRMYVRPAFRGGGLGERLVEHLAERARAYGVRVLRLETGVHQREAIALYERLGFRQIPPFGPYREDPLSRCYERRLE